MLPWLLQQQMSLPRHMRHGNAPGARLLAVLDSQHEARNPSVHTVMGDASGCPKPQESGQPVCLSLSSAPPAAGMAQGRVKLCCLSPLVSYWPSLEQQLRSLQGAEQGTLPQNVSMLMSIL